MTTLRGPDPYAVAEEQLAALFASGGRRERFSAPVCAILQGAVPTYNWVGIYRAAGATLALAAWRGPAEPATRVLPVVPGADDPADMAPLVVNDARGEPLARALVPDTRATIVVPIGSDGARSGALVVASAHRGAFGPADRALLEMVARRLGGEGAGEVAAPGR